MNNIRTNKQNMCFRLNEILKYLIGAEIFLFCFKFLHGEDGETIWLNWVIPS